MIKKILLILVVLLLVLVVVIATRPAEYSIMRSSAMVAPVDVVFTQVNDLHRWEAWSPWAKIDPDMEQTYEGPEAGVGASQSWAGNSEVGEGRMTITESRSNEWVRLKLEFFKPMEGVATTDFHFVPQDGGTTVTWTMSGTNNFVGKAFSLFMDMDEMLGGQFEQGLERLKAVAEAGTEE